MCRTAGRRCDSKHPTTLTSTQRKLRKHKQNLREALTEGNQQKATQEAQKILQTSQKLNQEAQKIGATITSTQETKPHTHQAPTNDGYSTPLTNLTNPPENTSTQETQQQLNKALNGAKTLTIYRTLPQGQTNISNGDWVTLSQEYAQHHANRESSPENPYHVISARVPTRHIYTDGNDPEEYGYDSRTQEEVAFWNELGRAEKKNAEAQKIAEYEAQIAEMEAKAKQREEERYANAFKGDKAPEPRDFSFVRNPVSLTENQAQGIYFGQDIEPAGRYMSPRSGDFVPEGWEAGEVHFKRPLYILEGGSYREEDNWKQRLYKHYGKTGRALSRAIRRDGYDAVITFSERYGEGEVVDLKGR